MRAGLLRLVLILLLLPAAARAADAEFTTSDGVKLHVIQAGRSGQNTIVFVPGWTMPAWIFQPQIEYFATQYHVVALDPRGQGESEIAPSGYDHLRRGQDVAELIAGLGNPKVLLVGWSLGVLDSLAYVQQYGDSQLAGLVLIDNSVGEDPPPVAARAPAVRGPRLGREAQMRRFVRGMFVHSPGEYYLERLTEAALRTPPEAAAALSSYPVPRTYWRDAIYSVNKPILYVVRPRFLGQARNLVTKHPMAEAELFAAAGHALFVDEAARFDLLLQNFITRRVWP
ncbi:MAG TPA: alpha/beta hydrolase [Acetobacteraceae bacterium]|nr:alpha/beta hydrolase [Acetobacteraceae bacterium]